MRLRRGTDAGAAAPDAAETVLRLAVLLQAGVTPLRAWEHLAHTGDAAAARVRQALDRGASLAAAIGAVGAAEAVGTVAAVGTAERPRWKSARRTRRRAGADRDGTAWRDVAAAWHVASTVGAPLAESLRGLAAAMRDAYEIRDEIRVALAEPAGTARLMAWLPLVAVALGVALGFDTIGILATHPIGIACLVAGGALIFAARRWSAALVRRAEASGAIPGLTAELLAIALSGGVSIERGRAIVADATGAAADRSTDDMLTLSRSAGVPAVELLRASAALARHRARVAGRLQAAHLSTRLLLPLGVCTLPAFLLLGVAPMFLSVVSAVPLSPIPALPGP